MRFEEINVYLLARTVPDRAALERWIHSLPGCDGYELPQGAADAELLISSAARRCYRSFEPGSNPNVTRVRRELADYFDHLLASGHGSVLEHATYTFAFENVTRVFTAELNRHRAGCAISEQSLRYVRFDDLPFWLPLTLREQEEDDETLRNRKKTTQILIRNLLSEIERVYTELVLLWDLKDAEDFGYKKKITSLLRRILPLGVCTGGVWTFNIRALRHIIATRSNPQAEEEICYVFGLIGREMRRLEPNLFADFERRDGFWCPRYAKV